MYIPRSLLILLVSIYFLFLLLISFDWLNQSDAAWYRPYVIGALIVAFASWIHRKRDSDEF